MHTGYVVENGWIASQCETIPYRTADAVTSSRRRTVGSIDTGGGSGGGQTCTEVIIEVSTDDGLTWQYDHTEWQC